MMRNNRLSRIEDVCYYVAIGFASIVITLSFIALIGKVVMSIFS